MLENVFSIKRYKSNRKSIFVTISNIISEKYTLNHAHGFCIYICIYLNQGAIKYG